MAGSRPKSAPGKRDGPPRSGKSIFVVQGTKPMVPASARTSPCESEVVARLYRGEAIHDPYGLVPKVHQPPSIPVCNVADPPTNQVFESAYPRHGSIHSLQYHNPNERQGAHLAPGAGRSSVLVQDHIWDMLGVRDGPSDVSLEEPLEATRQEYTPAASSGRIGQDQCQTRRRSLFSQIDSNHDGVITRAELDEAIRSGIKLEDYTPAASSCQAGQELGTCAVQVNSPVSPAVASPRMQEYTPAASSGHAGQELGTCSIGIKSPVSPAVASPRMLSTPGGKPRASGESSPRVRIEQYWVEDQLNEAAQLSRRSPAGSKQREAAHLGRSSPAGSVAQPSWVDAAQLSGVRSSAASSVSTPRKKISSRQGAVVQQTPRKTGAPPGTGKEIFLYKDRPMVPAGARKPVELSDAMERIVRGESSYSARGMIPVVNNPSDIPVSPVAQTPSMFDAESSYPRHGTINSLQYHNTVERSGAYKAPGAGRSSVLEPHCFAPPARISEQDVAVSPRETGAPKRSRSANATPTGTGRLAPSAGGNLVASEDVAKTARAASSRSRQGPPRRSRSAPVRGKAVPGSKGCARDRLRESDDQVTSQTIVGTTSVGVVTQTVNLQDKNSGACSVAPATGTFFVAPATGSFPVTPATGVFSVAPDTGAPSVAPATGSFSVAPATETFSVTQTATGYLSVTPATGSCSVATATGSVAVAPITGAPSAAPATVSSSVAPATESFSVAQAAGSCSVAPATRSLSVAPATAAPSVAPATGSFSVAPANFIGTQTVSLQTVDSSATPQSASVFADTAHYVPLQHDGPPRSGKSIFVALGSRSMVQSKGATEAKLSPAMERIVRGEPGYDPRGMVPKSHEPAEFPVRHVSDVPPMGDFDSAYPRYGTEYSLQYHSTVERAGAHQAPGAGRGSVWVPPDELCSLAD